MEEGVAGGTVLFILDSRENEEWDNLMDELLSTQRLDSSFVFLLWLETKLYLVDGSLTLGSFI